VLALLAAALLAAPPAHRIENVPYFEQLRGPFCAAATVAMAARSQGAAVEPLALAREVPVAADGIAWLDLADVLAPLGLETLVVVSDEDELRQAVAAGLPVVVATREGGGKHAVVVTGYDPGGWDVLDPANPSRRRLPRAELPAVWAGRQAVVVRRVSAAPGALPLERWRAQTRRYRALAWGLRAEAQPEPGGRLALYRRAVAEDPSIAELRNNLAIALAGAGQNAEACAELAAAAKLSPGWPVPGDNRRQLGCR
jgi:predicted double-glycine peptidase